jgi:nitrogen fixation protein FixH
MTTAVSAKPVLTGRKVFLLLVGFFSIIFLVNGVMIHLALKTFPGVEEQRPYERGLAYDREIAQARSQTERGWQAQGSFAPKSDGKAELAVSLTDRNGKMLSGLQVKAQLTSSIARKHDLDLVLREVSPGEYRADVEADKGAWLLDLIVTQNGEQMFRSHNRVTLR